MPTPVVPPIERRLFLIDGYAIIYRAFFALIARPLSTSRGENTSAAWGVANFIERLLLKHKPEFLGWVNDSGLSFRHEQYPDYKATREKLSDELQADFDRGVERIEQILHGYRIPILEVAGYEADDVIGSLTKKARRHDLNVVIVSGDKDFHQLVEPGVWLLNPGRGGPAAIDEQWVSVENSSDRLGVPPSRVTDYLALVGDSSDNVPGVKGIGDKTAISLIDQFGTLEEILTRAGELDKKRPREALLAQADNARLSKALVTIHTDLDVTLDLDVLQVGPPDTRQLRDLFVELEFHGLAKAMNESIPDTTTVSEIARHAHYVVVQNREDLERVVQRANELKRIAFDTETVLDVGAPTQVDPLRSRLVGLTIGIEPGEAYYFPFRHRTREEPSSDQPTLALEDPRDERLKGEPPAELRAESVVTYRNLGDFRDQELQPLRAMLEDPKIAKIAQNAKYDLLVLKREGVHVNGLAFDTMVASYVLDPGRRSHGLDMLALEFLGHEMISYETVCGKGKNAIGFDAVPIDAAARYSCEDADVTLRLATLFSGQMEQQGTERLFQDIEMPLVPILAEMEATGIAIDVSVFERLNKEIGIEQSRVEKEIYASAGEEFNINSNVQLRQILFEKLQLPIVKKTSTGASTDASVLERLAEEGHTLPGLIMEYRELTKLQGTYIETLPTLLNPETGRLHTSFNQTVAATGRLSSSDPNLQNIPVRTTLGREIRRAFIPRNQWVMLSADYSQIELRLLAHLSNDPAFVETFRAGGDIHRETAALIFSVAPSAVTPEMRNRAKTINFATIYGQGAHALSQQLRITHAEAKEFIENYFLRFTGVRAYLDSAIESARTKGYAETIFSRRRFIPELGEKNFNIRAFGERTAQNTPIQGSAADLIKIAMIQIAARLKREGRQSVMLLQVHDELVFETPPNEVDALRELVKAEMEGAARLSVPLVVDVGVGPNWLETKMS